MTLKIKAKLSNLTKYITVFIVVQSVIMPKVIKPNVTIESEVAPLMKPNLCTQADSKCMTYTHNLSRFSIFAQALENLTTRIVKLWQNIDFL